MHEIPFTAVGVDQAQEYENKVHKGEGGLAGITTSPDTLLQYCLTAPILAQLSHETESLVGMSTSKVQKHHQIFESKVARQEKYIVKLKSILEETNPFGFVDNQNKCSDMFNIVTKAIISKEIEKGILSTFRTW